VVVEVDVALFGEDGQRLVLRQLARGGRRHAQRLLLGEPAQLGAVAVDDVCVRLLEARLAGALPAEEEAAAVLRPVDGGRLVADEVGAAHDAVHGQLERRRRGLPVGAERRDEQREQEGARGQSAAARGCVHRHHPGGIIRPGGPGGRRSSGVEFYRETEKVNEQRDDTTKPEAESRPAPGGYYYDDDTGYEVFNPADEEEDGECEQEAG
jgi:hypothetical protein